MSAKVLGRYFEHAARDAEISLRFPQELAPWEAATRTAVFLDAWLAKSLAERGMQTQDLNYVINELMENAVKYAERGDIELCVGFQATGVVIGLSHMVATLRSRKYFELATALVQRDPEELFLEIIERNASAVDGQSQTGAGLGLVSLRQDYLADLAFNFSDFDARHQWVCTQVRLPWPNAQGHTAH